MLNLCVLFLIHYCFIVCYCTSCSPLSLLLGIIKVSSKSRKHDIGWIATLCRPFRLEFANSGTFPMTGLRLATHVERSESALRKTTKPSSLDVVYCLLLCLSSTPITSALKGSLHLKMSYSLMYKPPFNTTLKLHEAISLIYNINK